MTMTGLTPFDANCRIDYTSGRTSTTGKKRSMKTYLRIDLEDLGGSSCMVKNEEKGRKMTGFQRHQKIVVLMDILKPSQTSVAE